MYQKYLSPLGLSLGCLCTVAATAEPALASSILHFRDPSRWIEAARLSSPVMPARTHGADWPDHAAESRAWLASTTAEGAVWGKDKGKDDEKDEYEDEKDDEYEDEDEYEDVEKEEEEEEEEEEEDVTPPDPEVSTPDPDEPAEIPSAGVPGVLAELGSGGGSAYDELTVEDDPFKPFFENNVSGQTLAKILSYFGLQERYAAFADDGVVDIVWLEFERKASLKGLSVLVSGTDTAPDLSATVGRLAVLIFLDQSTITRQSDVVAVFGNGAYQAVRRPLR